ncbi:outer membrane beta-barrel protein [uncultured Methylobacterium sp.]|uniref:outer membrane beta-barrel protein n=1 Tax=uncultured Methylobacterium sp. TaxID=157278 RepID=UPI0035CA9251
MGVRPIRDCQAVAVLAFALVALPLDTLAQTTNTEPPASPTGDDGLLSLRRTTAPTPSTPGSNTNGDASGGGTLDGGSSGGAGRSAFATPARSGAGRTGGVTSGINNRAPSNFLRQRAAPPRRPGSATVGLTRLVTQVPPPDLRLSPIIQNPVVGVPLPAASFAPNLLPLAGLSTPGAVLNAALRRPLTVDDAYAPLGLRVGTFTVLPSLQQSIGYDTNPEQVVNRSARGSAALRTDAELNFRSDWSAHELAGELRGGYSGYPDNQSANRPNGAGNVRLRLDANRDTRIDVEGRFLIDTQRAGSPDLNATVAGRPIIASYGTTIGLTETFNRLQVSLRGLIDRSEFEDARLSNGTVLSQADRNLNQFGLRLRAAYEISPVISPFVDLLGNTRVYDQRFDSNGIRRDSDGVTLSAGAAFALTRFVAGEISAGFEHRTYEDPSLRDLTAPVINASLIWTASPLTTVRLTAATGIVETSLVGSSGVRTQVATLEVQHDLLRNLSLTVGGSYLTSDYDRIAISEQGFSATARLDYRFNRWLTMRGSYIYQQINSTTSGASFSSNTWLLGLRVNP